MSIVIRNDSVRFFPGAAYELVSDMFGISFTILGISSKLLTMVSNCIVILIVVVPLLQKQTYLSRRGAVVTHSVHR